jgi:hypothetical protein
VNANKNVHDCDYVSASRSKNVDESESVNDSRGVLPKLESSNGQSDTPPHNQDGDYDLIKD